MIKKYILIFSPLIIVIIISVIAYLVFNRTSKPQSTVEKGIAGCYVAHLANDVYSLNIISQQGENIEGELDINNAEKDSSTGTLKGKYKDGILLADYTFASEGTLSVNQVIFKKVGNDFIRGSGKPDDATGTRFDDLSKINYDTSVVYKVSIDNCILTPTIQPDVTLTEGRQCYTYSHDATATEPYTVNEFLDITINGTKVSGTKTGNQKGPDMTNGYTGKIAGTFEKNIITDILSYIVDGSNGKEKEIYQTNKTGIEKLRYPLIEEKGILVPNTTKKHTTMMYARVDCTSSN